MTCCCIEERCLIEWNFIWSQVVTVYLCLFTFPQNGERPLCAQFTHCQQLRTWVLGREICGADSLLGTRCPVLASSPWLRFGQLLLKSDLSKGALCHQSMSHTRICHVTSTHSLFPGILSLPPSSTYFCCCLQPCPCVTVCAAMMPFWKMLVNGWAVCLRINPFHRS